MLRGGLGPVTQILSPIPASAPDPSRSARHSLSGNPDRRADGTVPPPLGSIVPTLVSTATSVPITEAVIPAGLPLPPAVPVAVLTTFEGQAVFRVVEGGQPQFPEGMLFRLRKGTREVTGGVRW